MKIRYRSQIDGLRALAVVPVIFFHASLSSFQSGYLGVDIFFVISGYLITISLIEGEGTKRQRLAAFYERRVRRIAPALLVVTMATFVLAIVVAMPWRLAEISKSVIAAVTFSANFWFLSQDVYFATPSTFQPLQHLWSLAVEEQFYIIYPVIFISASIFTARIRILYLVLLLLCSIVLSEYLARDGGSQAFFRPDTRAWQLLLGALCAYCPSLAGRWRGVGAFLGVGLILLAYFALPAPATPGLLSLPACLGAVLVILCADRDNLTGRVLGISALSRTGLLSYSLYLWHQPLLALARIANLGALSSVQTAAVLAACLCLSVLTWRLVEQPARDRQFLSRRQIVWACVAGVLVLLVGAIASVATSGLVFRYDEQARRFMATADPLDDTGRGRAAAIAMGVCHFRADMSPPLDAFLKAWTCEGDASGQGILMVGDSHAADIAAGFRLNGMHVGQMTGAGCQLVPGKMNPHCRALFERALSTQGAPFKVLVMALDQTTRPLGEADMDEFLAYWGRFRLPIIWFSDMPQFPALVDRRLANRLHFGNDMAGSYPILLDAAKKNYLAMKSLSAGHFEVINSSALYCALSPENGPCLPYLSGSGWLALESGHLTALGARLFVGKFLTSQGGLVSKKE